jgi:hypothetical protein
MFCHGAIATGRGTGAGASMGALQAPGVPGRFGQVQPGVLGCEGEGVGDRNTPDRQTTDHFRHSALPAMP